MNYFALYKPSMVLSQFTDEGTGAQTLKDMYPFPPNVYPLGRLDRDSEGLLLLTDDRRLNDLLLSPRNRHEREYYVQVEGTPTDADLEPLRKRLRMKDYAALPAKAKVFQEPPALPERNPPIRFRKSVPDTWLSLTLQEGKNRQVRRMTAAIGFPTLRLVRWRIERIILEGMLPGNVKGFGREEFYGLLNLKDRP